ncbi:universal stress protein [Celeribacter indicus]|uniref:UspA domain-containing protein n=1 Tax=Celeribacter indicus TaxID=1208324 RepID=A0A0B5E4D1_9RHOB|nr:universal stress protein [Celeribacter indicus]AJE47197.1 hypothetical protein P73_2482 [Celeribacter indicus]SDW00461.1 Nucleotide-binding universal stress protein, UspA family [Celeribacter indicus]
MFSTIAVPVDLAHVAKLEKSLGVAGDIARIYEARVVYVSVTTATPGALAHSPEEFRTRLAAFAAQQAEARGIRTDSHVIVSHDPAVQMNRELEEALDTLDADLVVMATHVPNLADHLWSGHGAHIATHSDISVMLVRG